MPLKKAPFRESPIDKRTNKFTSVWERWFDYNARATVTGHDELEEESLSWDNSAHTPGDTAHTEPTNETELGGWEGDNPVKILAKYLPGATDATDQTIGGDAGTIGKIYYLTTTDDTWLEVDHTDVSTMSGLVGWCSAANTIRFLGLIPLAAHGLGDNKAPIFCGTSGNPTGTRPDTEDYISRIVGYVEDENNVRVSIANDYFTVGAYTGTYKAINGTTSDIPTVTVAETAPSSPTTGDVWVDI